MEKPYQGRATLQDNITDVQILIPSRRNWFIIVFLGAWLCGWLMGEVFALTAIAGIGDNPVNLFLLFWLVGWTVGGLFAFRTLLWTLKGKEIITLGQGQLKVEKKGALFSRPKVYDLREVKKVRVQEDGSGLGSVFGHRRNDLGALASAGAIRFDYGLQTVRIAAGIDEAEAQHLLDQLKRRRLLTEANYG